MQLRRQALRLLCLDAAAQVPRDACRRGHTAGCQVDQNPVAHALLGGGRHGCRALLPAGRPCLLCGWGTSLLSGVCSADQANGCSWKHGKALETCCLLKMLCCADSLATQPSSIRLTSDFMLGPLL